MHYDPYKKQKKGDIHIWSEAKNHRYELHFKDTGNGMSQDNLKHAFDRFFFKKKEDEGKEETIMPGLGFCKLALLQRHGDILCQSKEREYTEFVIIFERV